MSGIRLVCLLSQPDFKPGDPPPEGYLAWHEWAGVQWKAGLRQYECGKCSRWCFPQELSRETVTYTGTTRKHGGQRLKFIYPVCKKCHEAALTAAREG